MISISKVKLSLILCFLFSIPVFSQETYIVCKGDTLYNIAKKKGVRVEQIRTWNNLSNNSLTIGQKLVLNGKSGKKTGWHTVRHGETLWRIAFNYGISIRELMDINSLSQVGSLKSGQKLKVPATSTGDEPNIKKPDPIKTKLPLLAWPVHGVVTLSPDGKSVHISCSAGENVRPTADGTVEYTGSLVGYKNVVILRHPDELYSIYGALGAINVKKGDNVVVSTVLGTVQKLPHEHETFLYFEIVKNGQNADPRPQLK